VASSARSVTRAVNVNRTEWDCRVICGALNEDGECSDFEGCVEMGSGMVKGGRLPGVSSAGGMRLSGHSGEMAVAIVVLVVGACMLL
jgi:hypothetical protein